MHPMPLLPLLPVVVISLMLLLMLLLLSLWLLWLLQQHFHQHISPDLHCVRGGRLLQWL